MSSDVAAPGAERCGIDSVEIARIERLLRETPADGLGAFFSAQELADAGDGPGRAASLAARFAAKEACLKLFPRGAALGQVEATDFSVARDAYGAPRLVCNAAAQYQLDLHRIARVELSLTHDRVSASAVALAVPARTAPSRAGRFIRRFLPLRGKIVTANLQRVYGAYVEPDEIERLAAAHYGHLWRLLGEFIRFRWLSAARKKALVRVEGIDNFIAARDQGKGILILTGHFGNWEVSTTAGIAQFPEMRGKFHFVRRPIKPDWLDRLVTRRFEAAGFGVFSKRDSLDAMLESLAQGDAVVLPFDQHAGPPDGIAVDFLGHPAWTFKSLAIIALSTGAPVLPGSSWREADGRHVLRFEAPLAPIEHDSTTEAIRLNTRAYNAALEQLVVRHPEQWYWVHRRWKHVEPRPKRRTARVEPQ
ncbi:MAG: 4'-phosphopantetheinyl transferase superfamily protein [Rhizobacter sp.]|nr:4'-phosphopantetheinyl transferase superfamily protein [Burkholderiaceae bacterium]MCO5123775.1 4'-phosphopantetheinyl transferase superfamily protein [Rhizobacter sp.]